MPNRTTRFVRVFWHSPNLDCKATIACSVFYHASFSQIPAGFCPSSHHFLLFYCNMSLRCIHLSNHTPVKRSAGGLCAVTLTFQWFSDLGSTDTREQKFARVHSKRSGTVARTPQNISRIIVFKIKKAGKINVLKSQQMNQHIINKKKFVALHYRGTSKQTMF